jgi:hypothetical protein
MQKVPKYIIVDFQGYYHWSKRDDGAYAVDPLYLEEFKEWLKTK